MVFAALAAPLIGAVAAPLMNKLLGGGGGGEGAAAQVNPLAGDITALARQIAAVPYQALPTRRVNAPTKPWESGELYNLQQAMDSQYAAQNQPGQPGMPGQGNGQVGLPGMGAPAGSAAEWAQQQIAINPYAGLGRYGVPLANPNDPFQGMRQGGERGYTSRGERGRQMMAKPVQRQLLEDAFNRYTMQQTATPIDSDATPHGGGGFLSKGLSQGLAGQIASQF
jgi:hypothetical protein